MSLILSGTDGLSDVDGSAATPAIRGTDANTGIFFPAADTIAFAEGGAEVARFDSSGNLGIGTTTPGSRLDVNSTDASVLTVRRSGGTDTNTAIRFQGASTSYYIGRTTSGGLGFSYNAADVTGESDMILDSSGRLGIGTSSPTSILTIGQGSFTAAGSNTTGMYTGASGAGLVVLTDAFLVATRVAGTTLFSIGTGGIITSPATYSNTSAGAANMFVQTDGTFYRGGVSALKYKQDVRDLELIDINKFRAVRYKSKCEFDDQTIDYFGFIADEVDAAGIKELITYGADGEVEGFQYERFTVVLLKELQKQQALITQLTARITALESA
jgi:hypothetical protein